MPQLKFHVQGSSAEPYLVTFIRSAESLIATCTCAAGSMGQYCKHRISIATGVADGIVSANLHDLAELAKWIQGSVIETSVNSLREAERDLDDAKRRVSRAKQQIASAMRGKN